MFPSSERILGPGGLRGDKTRGPVKEGIERSRVTFTSFGKGGVALKSKEGEQITTVASVHATEGEGQANRGGQEDAGEIQVVDLGTCSVKTKRKKKFPKVWERLRKAKDKKSKKEPNSLLYY